MNTLNLNLKINNKKLNLLNNLTKHTNMPIDSLVNNLVNGKRTWKAYEEINRILEIRNRKDNKFYTAEQVRESLNTGIIPNL